MRNFWNKLPLVLTVSDLFQDRKATRAVHDLDKKYKAKVAKAQKEHDRDAYDLAMHEWHVGSNEWLHPVYARKAARITAAARRYGITVPPKPNDPAEDSAHWYMSNETGDWLLTTELEQHLRREIRTEKRASYDEFRKWATLAFAIAGFVLAFYSLRVKSKQPDPCQRNYYRADSGECIFAAQTSGRLKITTH